MLHATRAALSRRFNDFDDALDSWAERHGAVLRLVGFVVSFALLLGGVALQAFESGFARAIAALCGAACTSVAGDQLIIALACGAAAVLFVWTFAALTSAVQRAIADPWQHVRPGPPPPRVALWVMILHVLIGLVLFFTMAWFGQKLVHGQLFELGIEGPKTFRVRLGNRAMLALILGMVERRERRAEILLAAVVALYALRTSAGPIVSGTRTALLAVAAFAMMPSLAHSADALPQRVTFSSADGKTTLVGYLFVPAQGGAQRRPAVVMMHGRAGAYSSLARGVYDAATLSKRHQAWGALWAAQGYVALLVDGFGPRGYPAGFPRHSYESRPAELDEVTVRPLDAYETLAYLRARPDVDGAHVGLQGWSNGGSATLVAMAAGSGFTPAAHKGFAAALAFYPACGLKDAFKESDYQPYAPVRVFMGTADEEVSPKRCETLVDASRAAGGDIMIRLYPGATHGFDAPSTRRQMIEANADATEDAVKRAVGFFRQQFDR